MNGRLQGIVALCTAVSALGYLYADVMRDLLRDWSTDDNYSHGFLIVPIAGYLAWERRAALRRAAPAPRSAGLVLIVAGLLMLISGMLGAELFIARLSLLAVLAGGIVFVLGWAQLRILWFPLAFLLLMIPIPAILFNQIAFPLQLVASRVGAAGLGALGIPVLREGNVIALASITLEVAEACSGIRSLVSLFTLGVVVAYFMESRPWARTAIALATVPIAIVSNGLRVAGTGVAAHYYGPEAAEGFMHTFSGWLVFIVAIVLLLAVQQMLAWAFPARPGAGPGAAAGHTAAAAARA